MKKCFVLLIVLLVILGSGFAQEMNKKYQDPKLNKEVLIGYCNRQGLEQGDFGEKFKTEYELYQVKKSEIRKIKSLKRKNNIEIITVFGDWCHDSQVQVPRFFKVLDKSGFKTKKSKIIAVDRIKSAQSLDISKYNIQRVPTFIVFLDNKEIGRIIESPELSLEEDFLKIMRSIK